jgi:hypothetical protein
LRTFPGAVSLNGMCIESESLHKESQLVSDENLCISNLKDLQCLSLHELLAEYRTRHQYSLNINNNLRNFKELTDVETILKLRPNDVNRSSRDTEIKSVHFKVKNEGKVNALLYWFELIDENSEYFMQIDSDSSTSSCDGPTKLQKASFSPFTASLIDGANNSNQLAAVCFYEANNSEIGDFARHGLVKVDYLFRNDIFHAKSFELLASKEL